LFNKSDFIRQGEDVLDLRRFSTQQIDDLSNELNNIMNMKDVNIYWIMEYVKKINSIRSDSPYKSMRTNLDFYNWVFGDYFSIIIKVLFNSVSMEKLSMGQKATVLLKLFLAEGDNPLIIDQPEENLDNKFIYESLVDAFRDAKKKRQIIIATHNANLVVNTDSEQIIISEYKDGKITYTSGSIEDKMIKKNITALLEGGEEAFKRRELRYGI
jgi:hypothetical protein